MTIESEKEIIIDRGMMIDDDWLYVMIDDG